MSIVCRSQVEIDKLRRANQLVADVLAELRAMVAPGVTTQEIDRVAEMRVREAGGKPAFKGYHGYPATVCASINEQVVHGIPSDRPLVNGDIVSIDMGAVLEGYYGDCAVTVPVGVISAEARELLRVTEESLFRGIDAVKPGARVSDIGAAVQQHVEAAGFSVVREFVGHGIGTSLHEEPQIANYGPAGHGPRLSEGMVFAIEPMVNAGKADVKVLSDGWTAVTRDGRLSAHFEHSVVVTRDGCEILTLLAADAARAKQLLGTPVRSTLGGRRVDEARVEGIVTAQLPSGLYHVEIEGKHRITAHVGGNGGGGERNFVRVLVGDRVLVELTPRDTTRGRIVRKA